MGEIVYSDLVGLDEEEAYAVMGEDIIGKIPTSPFGDKQRLVPEQPLFPGTPLSKTAKTIEVFIAYSHRDEALQRELVSYLRPLEKQGLITIWSDQYIQAGMEWESEINRHLKTARV